MLRIIHTADWHIGKNLHKVPMQDEIRLFFDWLIATIVDKKVDLLLVAGDIFDYANPAAEDRKMYFTFLKRLIDTDTKIIITGGNHDSAGFLNAPKEILDALDIYIIGEATEEIENEIVEILDEEGNIQLVVAAVPFLKDRDLRHRDNRHQFENRIQEIRAGIARHYEKLGEICERKYSAIAKIAMGHLYAVGADPSESERDIHMGNEAAVSASVFPKAFDYVALGHIHRPQVIAKNEYIRYSGSPIALSFSEKSDLKSLIYLELDGATVQQPQLLPIPKSRDLVRISGTLSEVRKKLANYRPERVLPSFLEIIITEEVFSSSVLAEWENLKQDYQHQEGFKIIRDKVSFEKGARDISELFEESISIVELKPAQVFMKKLASEEIEDDRADLLRDAFHELLEGLEYED